MIRFVFFSFIPSLVAPNEAASVWRLLIQAVWSSMPTWFLYALAVFFVGAKVLNRLPVWAQIVGTGAVSLVFMADLITLPSSLWTGLAEYFVFFLIGMHGSDVLRSGVARPRGRATVLVLVPIWSVIAWSAVEAGWLEMLGNRFLLSLLAIPAGIGMGVLLSWSRAFRYMGEHTMPIYLAHTLIQGGIAVLLQSVPATTLEGWSGWLPIALVLVSVLGALVPYWLVRRIGVKGIYEPPRWLASSVKDRPRHLMLASRP